MISTGCFFGKLLIIADKYGIIPLIRYNREIKMDQATFNKLLKKAGHDTCAFETLFCHYYKRIVLHLFRVFGRTVAEDAAQEFFVNIIRKEPQGKITNPTAWVYACAENIAKRMIGKESNNVCLDVIENTVISTNLELLSQEELFGDLYQVIKKLTDEEQRIIYLLYWEGYNLKEVSEIIGISHSSARQKHSRAIKKMKANGVTL